MIRDRQDGAPPTNDEVGPEHSLSYLSTEPEDGDLETGVVLLDRRPIGRLHHRRCPGASRTILEPDSAWHADAIGWVPDVTRPWDTRITRTAPTRRRAAEDTLRAYLKPR